MHLGESWLEGPQPPPQRPPPPPPQPPPQQQQRNTTDVFLALPLNLITRWGGMGGVVGTSCTSHGCMRLWAHTCMGT